MRKGPARLGSEIGSRTDLSLSVWKWPPLTETLKGASQVLREDSQDSLWPQRDLARDMKVRIRRIASKRSFRDVMARKGSWALLSRGRTASTHQHQEGPLGLAWKRWKSLELFWHLKVTSSKPAFCKGEPVNWVQQSKLIQELFCLHQETLSLFYRVNVYPKLPTPTAQAVPLPCSMSSAPQMSSHWKEGKKTERKK